MKTKSAILAFGLLLGAVIPAQADPLRVNVDNFKRAESDTYFAKFVKDGGFSRFQHAREPVPVEKQDVIRMNRDTLYSSAVVDLQSGGAKVTLPKMDQRFMSMQVINQDHFTTGVIYDPGVHSFDQAKVGTRYVLFLVRTFVDPNDPADLKQVHALQDALKIEQDQPGAFAIPGWDAGSLKKIRDALNTLTEANGGLDSARMFGSKEEVDPVQHLLGTAAGWGGNPLKAAFYSGVVPEMNDGKTVYKLTVKDVPVDGFWSISVYNKAGFFEKNDRQIYSLNNITAKTGADGSVTVQFGGDDVSANVIPVSPGWSYLVRMYRPRAEILSGQWKFPEAQPVQ